MMWLFVHFLLGMMGFGHIFMYCIPFRYIFLQVFFSQAKTTRFALKLVESILGETRGEVWTLNLGRKSVDHFFFEKTSHDIRRACRFVMFFFWDPVGLQSEILEETSRKILFGASKSILVECPPPSSTGKWRFGETSRFFWACRFFLKAKACTLDFFFLAPWTRVVPPGVVPGYENKQLYLEDEAVPPLKILGLTALVPLFPPSFARVSGDELKWMNRLKWVKPQIFSRFLCCQKIAKQELVKIPWICMHFQQWWEDFPAIVRWHLLKGFFFSSRQKSEKIVNTPRPERVTFVKTVHFLSLNVLRGPSQQPQSTSHGKAIWKGNNPT